MKIVTVFNLVIKSWYDKINTEGWFSYQWACHDSRDSSMFKCITSSDNSRQAHTNISPCNGSTSQVLSFYWVESLKISQQEPPSVAWTRRWVIKVLNCWLIITYYYFVFSVAGLSTNLIYPNGISCTLPADIQQEMIRTIAGLENATMVCPGTLTMLSSLLSERHETSHVL